MTDFSPKHDATNWVDYVNQGSTSELKQGEGMKNLGDQIRGVRRLSLEQIAGALNNRDIPAGLTEPQKAALKSTWETELMEKLVEEKAKAMPAEALEKISAIGSDDDGLEDVKAHAVAAFERVIGARKDRNARENAGKKVRRLTTLGRKTADATEEERRSTGRHRSLFLEASVLALKDLRLPSDHLEALEKLLSERQKITEQIEDTEVQQSAAQERLDIHAQKVEKFKSFRTKLTKWIVGLGTLGPALPVILPKTLGLVVGGLGKGVSLLAGSAKLSIASGKAFSYLWALGGKGFIGWAAMPHIALAGIGTYVAVRLALQVYRSKKLQHLNFFTETGRAARQHGKAVRSREGNKIPIWNRIETLFGKEPTRVGGLKRSLTSADKKIKKHMETLLPERSALVSRYKTLESHKEAAQTRLTETEAEMARLEGAGRTSAPAYQTALEKKDQYEKEIAEYDQLLPRLARVLAEYSKCDEVLESHLPAMATELIKEQHGVPDEVKVLIGDAMRKVEDQVDGETVSTRQELSRVDKTKLELELTALTSKPEAISLIALVRSLHHQPRKSVLEFKAELRRKHHDVLKVEGQLPEVMKVLNAAARMLPQDRFKSANLAALDFKLSRALVVPDKPAEPAKLTSEPLEQSSRREAVYTSSKHSRSDYLETLFEVGAGDADCQNGLGTVYDELFNAPWFSPEMLPLPWGQSEQLLSAVALVNLSEDSSPGRTIDDARLQRALGDMAVGAGTTAAFCEGVSRIFRQEALLADQKFPAPEMEGAFNHPLLAETKRTDGPLLAFTLNQMTAHLPASPALKRLQGLRSETLSNEYKRIVDTFKEIRDGIDFHPVADAGFSRRDEFLLRAARAAVAAGPADISIYCAILKKCVLAENANYLLSGITFVDSDGEQHSLREFEDFSGAGPLRIRGVPHPFQYLIGHLDYLRNPTPIGRLEGLEKMVRYLKGQTVEDGGPQKMPSTREFEVTGTKPTQALWLRKEFAISAADLAAGNIKGIKLAALQQIYTDPANFAVNTLLTPGGDQDAIIALVAPTAEHIQGIADRIKTSAAFKGKFDAITGLVGDLRGFATPLGSAGAGPLNIVNQLNELIPTVLKLCKVEAGVLVFRESITARDGFNTFVNPYSDYLASPAGMNQLFEIGHALPGSVLPEVPPATVTGAANDGARKVALKKWILETADFDQVRSIRILLEMIGEGKRYHFVATERKLVDSTQAPVPPPVPPGAPPPVPPGPAALPAVPPGTELARAHADFAAEIARLQRHAVIRPVVDLFVGHAINADLATKLTTFTGQAFVAGVSFEDQLDGHVNKARLQEIVNRLVARLISAGQSVYVPWKPDLDGHVDTTTIKEKAEIIRDIDRDLTAINGPIKTAMKYWPGAGVVPSTPPTFDFATGANLNKVKVWMHGGPGMETLDSLNMNVSKPAGQWQLGVVALDTLASEKLRMLHHNAGALKHQIQNQNIFRYKKGLIDFTRPEFVHAAGMLVAPGRPASHPAPAVEFQLRVIP